MHTTNTLQTANIYFLCLQLFFTIITTILKCWRTLWEKNDFLNIEYFVHVEIGLKFLNLTPPGAQLIRSYYHEAPLVFPIVLF